MKRIVALVALTLSSACATMQTTAASQEELQAVVEGRSSALVTNISGDVGCIESIVGVYREGADKSEVLWTVRDADDETSEPAVLVVQPGRYAVSGAACFRPGYVSTELPMVEYWFMPVAIEPGEAVYLGTLSAERVDAEARYAESDFGRLYEDRPTTTYVAYEFQDRSDEVRERLRESHPQLIDRLVVRAPAALLTRDEFVAAIEIAYAPGADGASPTVDEARARLAERLAALFAAATGQSGEPAGSAGGGAEDLAAGSD